MSCCGGNCGCASGCKCGSGCGGCKMYADLGGERGTNTAGIVDLGAATQKGRIDGHEVAAGSESGGCDCNKCNCGGSCSCACCGCN
ncbi:hypothetical protein MUK42_12882 [Musa troglodytarum]|uniref:Metallothionein-like protein n=1 Tax=Musa troglodytarum TaxID=320322 RepID=A0A9E7GWA2_9LILI|nr:hypothetical protein MUK42_12882 [Musa troglodytarum]